MKVQSFFYWQRAAEKQKSFDVFLTVVIADLSKGLFKTKKQKTDFTI